MADDTKTMDELQAERASAYLDLALQFNESAPLTLGAATAVSGQAAVLAVEEFAPFAQYTPAATGIAAESVELQEAVTVEGRGRGLS